MNNFSQSIPVKSLLEIQAVGNDERDLVDGVGKIIMIFEW